MQEDTRFHPWPLFDRVHYKYIWCKHTFTHIQKKNLEPFWVELKDYGHLLLKFP